MAANRVKGCTASVGLYHLPEGRHRGFLAWHDDDHRPEVLGTVPNVFASQRWVAPPAFVAARPSTELPHDGGEYLVLHWSAGTPQQLDSDLYLLGRRLAGLNRMRPSTYFDRVWLNRLHVVSGQTCGSGGLSAEAVTCAPNTGLVLSIEQILQHDRRQEYEHWLETVLTAAVLGTRLFRASFSLVPLPDSDKQTAVRCYYTDQPDPLDTFQQFQRQRAALELREFEDMRRTVFLGVFCPSERSNYDLYD
jgi:hypothetical protein